MGHLILVRHGESRWNIANRFTGWVNVPLSQAGIYEALLAAQKLKDIEFDVAFSSHLVRAQETLLLILSEQDACGIFEHTESKKAQAWSTHHKTTGYEIPVFSSEKLNERRYGELQGMDKDEARRKYGKEQVFRWRRGYTDRPPGGESLKDVVKRVTAYYASHILPQLKKGRNVLVVAHGNSLRGLIKHIDNISDEDIPHLELPLGIPLIYEYKRGKLTARSDIHHYDRPVHWQHHKPFTQQELSRLRAK